jgi:hypothetical protein
MLPGWRGKSPQPRQIRLDQRKGGDSNPRDGGCPSNGFQDRRIQPLCHPSERVQILRGYSAGSRLARRSQGEVAEWLKALAC